MRTNWCVYLCLGLITSSVAHSSTHPVDKLTSPPGCKTALSRQTDRGTIAYVEQMLSPFDFRIESSAGLTVIPTANAWFNGSPESYEVREEFSDLVRYHMNISPEERAKVDQTMTAYHAGLGMTFRKKSADGAYDQEFQVAVNSAVMPIPGEQFDTMVSATGPVLRKLRSMIQDLAAGQMKTPSDLGLDLLTQKDQLAVFERLTESPYLIKSLQSPEMADYPALAISGVDAALGKVYESIYELFEINTGTPSGLSNLSLLLESLRVNDPGQFKQILGHLGQDDTFQLLKKTIEESSSAWTQRSDGLSVIISPGPGNGAYPDVAAISILSGMPLVRLSDLYIDGSGDLRMLANSQLVTGIYSRAEESFLFNDPEFGIGMLAPDNERINERINSHLESGETPLEPFVTYVYVYDGSEVVDVLRDEDGQPMIAAYWDQISKDPNTGKKGSLAKAFRDRKVFVSNAFGRVADDKFVFQKVAEQLELGGVQPLAGPPPSLAFDRYDLFFENPDLYVPKVTDESGGSGVYLMISLPADKKRQVIEMVRSQPPEDYVIQQRIEPLLMVGAEENIDGSYSMGTRMAGWRIFVFMDPQGNVQTSDRAVLVRTASVGSLSENTSQGGGYGIGVPWRNLDTQSNDASRGRREDLGRSLLPRPAQPAQMTDSQISGIKSFNATLAKLVLNHRVEGEAYEVSQVIQSLSDLRYLMRELMPVFGFNFTQEEYQLASILETRNIKQHKVTGFLRGLTTKMRRKLSAASDGREIFPVAGVESYLQAPLLNHSHEQALPVGGLDQRRVNVEALTGVQKVRDSLLTVSPYSQVDWSYKSDSGIETGRYELVTDQALIQKYPSLRRYNEIVSTVISHGGVVVMNEYVNTDNSSAQSGYPPAYLRIDASGKPVLAFNKFTPNALAALEHEFVHFQSWLRIFQELLNSPKDLTHLEAAKVATDMIFEPGFVFDDEMRAVRAELNSQISGGVLNFDSEGTSNLEAKTIRRLIYPYLASINKAIQQEQVAFAQSKVDQMVFDLVDKKKVSKEEIREEIIKASDPTSKQRLQMELVYLENLPLIHLALGQSDRMRFENSGSLGQFYQLFVNALHHQDNSVLSAKEKGIEESAVKSIGSFYLNMKQGQQ